MKKLFLLIILLGFTINLPAQDHPYITTKSPLTLLSANDGETAPFELTTPDGLADWVLKRKDSFTVIQLGPDHPPQIRTVYDRVPVTIWGTPTMANICVGQRGSFGVNDVRKLFVSKPMISDESVSSVL